MKINLTVIVPTKNDLDNLEKCISKLTKFSQVIIVDSDENSLTKRLVENFNFHYVVFNWDGQFPKKRNWVLENIDIKNEWVLFLDSDEFINEDFINEIQFTLTNNSIYDAYILNYTNYFLGKELRFGEKMRKIALIKKHLRYERYDNLDTSGFDMEIHEHPIGYLSLGMIKSNIFHQDFKGLSHYLHKHNLYSDWEASRLHSKLDFNNLTQKQHIKYKLLKSPFGCIIYFFYFYFLKFGFLDGFRGFAFISLKAYYFYIIYLKYRFNNYNK